VHSMHRERSFNKHFHKTMSVRDCSMNNLEDMKLLMSRYNGYQYTDQRLIFIYDQGRKVFQPFMINASDEAPLIGAMKQVPIDISEPHLFQRINTVTLAFFEKYKVFRYADDLTNSRKSIMALVKSKELTEFSFYLSPEDLFIAEMLQKGKLYRANWKTRPRINLDELRTLNSQFIAKFGKDLPHLSLHLANILETGSTYIMTNRSKRFVKTASSLSK